MQNLQNAQITEHVGAWKYLLYQKQLICRVSGEQAESQNHV